MLKPETRARLRELAEEMTGLLSLQQGHFEVHVHKGEPKEIHVMDKSLKLDKDQASH